MKRKKKEKKIYRHLFCCSSTQTMPQFNEDKNHENGPYTPSHFEIVFTIEAGGEKYKQTPVH